MINYQYVAPNQANILTTPANPYKRKHILVCDLGMEQDAPQNFTGIRLIEWLNLKYNESIYDLAPYHYYIDTDGKIYGSKFETLKLGDVTAFRGFEDDISILVLVQNLNVMTVPQKDSLVNVIAQLGLDHAITTSDIIFFPEEIESFSIENSSLYSSLRASVIQRKTELDPVSLIAESNVKSADDLRNIRIAKCTERCYSFGDWSHVLNIPENVLRQQNPHITTPDLKPGDVILYIETATAKSVTLSTDYWKTTENYYNNIIQDII